MFVPTIIMAILAVALLILGYYRGGHHIDGLKAGMNMMVEIIPLLIFAFIIAGMVQFLFPKETLTKWIGEGSGVRGIFIGSVAGAFTPGGPYVNFPIAAGLMRAGASIPTMVAFITGWSLWGLSRLPLEVGILGWRFALVRIVSILVFPPLAGLLAQFFVKIIK